ncbi:sensor domain-containing diguanylate cyclase [Indioceanicola profundi]|uniref:sensor domain-containing diguanylate cyclase n=1 Tax=Indioceanicola profundi TaxID=2220096 RepID=UPI001968F573|nr:diguanylate cyclase [Indioceanicola profundi]
MIRSTEVETTNLGRSLAQHVHGVVQSADTLLLGLLDEIERDGLSEVAIENMRERMLARVGQLPSLHGLFLYDAEGRWLATSFPAAPLASRNNADRTYFQYHRLNRDRRAYIGPAVRSKTTGEWILTVSRRVDTADGGFAGVLLATVSIAFFQNAFDSFDVGRQGLIVLGHADGTILARKPFSEAAIGMDLSKGPVFSVYLPNAPVGTYESISPVDGVGRIGSYRRVEDYPLVVIVSRSVSEMLADWERDALFRLAAMLVIAGLIAVLGFRLVSQARRLSEAEEQYRLLAEHSGDAITSLGADGIRRYASPAYAVLTGLPAAMAVGKQWQEGVHPDQRGHVEAAIQRTWSGAETTATFQIRRHDGSYLWVEAKLRLMPDTKVGTPLLVANIRDISRRKALEERLEAANSELRVLANADKLTGLANRRRLDEALRLEWRRMARKAEPLSFILIDVDHFKAYNDRYGHVSGDHCLARIGAIVAKAARRPGDLAARYGGEELALLLPGTDLAGAADVAEGVRAALAHASMLHEGNGGGMVTASFGVATMHPALNPDMEISIHTLVSDADGALYAAKAAGRNQVRRAAEGVPENSDGGLREPPPSGQPKLLHSDEARQTHIFD